MKKFDKIALNIFGLLIILVWLNYIIDGFVEALFVSILIYIAVRTIIAHLINRYKKLKTITVWEMSQAFAIMGVEEQCIHFAKLIPDSYNPIIDNNYIIFEKNNKKILIFPIFKTVILNTEEILKVWRFARNKDILTIWVLARSSQRNVIILANSLDGEFIFFQARKIHRFLLNHNALPEKNFSLKKSTAKISFAAAVSDIFVRKRIKYFMFSGIVLAFMSFFVPLTVYYLVMSTIMFGLSVACLVLDR